MNLLQIEQARSDFAKSEPDFTSFESPGDGFANGELRWKQELSHRFNELGKQLINNEAAIFASEFMAQFKELLTKKLPDSGELQNLAVYLHPKLPQDLHWKLPHPESLIMAHI